MTQTFTIRRRQRLYRSLRDAEGNRTLVPMIETSLYPGYGRDPRQAVEDLIEALASDALDDDITPDDDDYAPELARAIDDVEGSFEVFEGALDAIPVDAVPVHIDGDIPMIEAQTA